MPEKVISDAITTSRSWRRLSDQARALFVPVLVETDRWGRRDGDFERLRLDCIPGLDWPDEKLLSALEDLVREGMVALYCVEGRWYIQVVNHDRFQRQLVRRHRAPSLFPDPPAPPGSIVQPRLPGEYLVHASARARDSEEGLGSSRVNEGSASVAVQSGLALNLNQSEKNGTAERGSLAWFLERIDATERTPVAVATVMRKWRLPAAAMFAALEEVQAGGASIRNKAGLFVAKLDEYGKSGRYAS